MLKSKDWTCRGLTMSMCVCVCVLYLLYFCHLFVVISSFSYFNLVILENHFPVFIACKKKKKKKNVLVHTEKMLNNVF